LRSNWARSTVARVRIAQSRIVRLFLAVAVAVAAPSASALASNLNVTVSSNVFTPSTVTVFQGETVTWTNTGNPPGTHNVKFDDGTYTQPSPPSSAAWTVSRTFTTPGSFRYYCQVHGGPGGVGMSGIVNVTAATGYPRPKGATPMRASLAPAYKPCTGAGNRTHGAPLAFPSCNPPVQVSDYLTVGTPDAIGNGQPAKSIGSVLLRVLSGDVSISTSLTDVRKKSDLTDYTGQLQARFPLRITDRFNGPANDEPATGDTTFAVTVPCTPTSADTTIGSACSIATTANAVTPGAVVSSVRAIWEVSGVQVFDGGADGVASTTADNTLFADQAVFIP
jgi:plastocyanin